VKGWGEGDMMAYWGAIWGPVEIIGFP